MDMLKKYFPLSFRGKEVKDLVISIVIYIVASAILGVLLGILGNIPVVNLVTGIVGTLVWIYSVAGIVIAILDFVGVFDKKD